MRVKFFIIKPTRFTNFPYLFLKWKSTCFGYFLCSSSGVFHLSSILIRLASCKPVWHITLLWVQWKTADDGQRNCPKHVEFHSKNKFEKLVHLVDFIIRNYLPTFRDNLSVPSSREKKLNMGCPETSVNTILLRVNIPEERKITLSDASNFLWMWAERDITGYYSGTADDSNLSWCYGLSLDEWFPGGQTVQKHL